jgi:hypothetical protein
MGRTVPPRWGAFSGVVLVASVLTACGVSVSVHPVIDDTDYKAIWSRDWQPVIRDASLWVPSSASPGVCNKGGAKQGCYDTDAKVVSGLQHLLTDLQTTRAPEAFRDANAALEEAITLDIDGLGQRNTAIAQNDEPLLTQAIAKLKRANGLFRSGYAMFPDYDRPLPQPFGPDGYSG